MTVETTSLSVGTTSRWAGRLYEAIERAGFSIGGFARRMGVHRTTIWRIELGQIQPSDDFNARAAALLNIPASEQSAA